MIAIHPSQIETVNWTKINLDYNRELSDSLTVELDRCNEALIVAQEAIYSLEYELSIIERENVILLRENERLSNALENKNKAYKKLRNGTKALAFVAILEGVALMLLR